jgi:hypothetical protein
MQVVLRSPKIAQRVFGLDSPGQIVRSVPRTKFMFKAEFTLGAAANNMMQNIGLNLWQDTDNIAYKVKVIDKPRIGLAATELNQYNKKKIVYTKIEYNEATLRLHDTVDNSMLNVWVNYFTYFFGDSRPKVDSNYRQGSVSPLFEDNTGWGLRPISENTNFFDAITVYALFANTYTSFKYINPKITNIDWQNYDYSSSDPEEVSVTFKYEAIEYQKFGQPYVEGDDFESGFLAEDTLYVGGFTKTTPQSVQPLIFTNQQASISTTIQTSNISDPTADPLTQTANQNAAVAPGATVPTELINGSVDTSTITPGTTAASSMLFISSKYQGSTTAPAPDIGTGLTPPSSIARSTTSTTTSSSTITEQASTLIGGEPFVPGQPLSKTQIAAITMGSKLGNSYSPLVLAQYQKQLQTLIPTP